MRRVSDPALFARPVVVTNGQYRFLVAKQLRSRDGAGSIVMFGTQPTRAATEYGYICPGRRSRPLFGIERFVEKPDAESAVRYVAKGHLWNSSNFVFRGGFLLEEYRRFEPKAAPRWTRRSSRPVHAGTHVGQWHEGASFHYLSAMQEAFPCKDERK